MSAKPEMSIRMSAVFRQTECGTLNEADLQKVAQLRQSLLERQTIYAYCSAHYGRRYLGLTIPTVALTISICILVSLWPFLDGADVEVAIGLL